MEAILTKDIISALGSAPLMQGQKLSRLRVDAAGKTHRVLRTWKTGFSTEAKNAPELRGLVDLYDGKTYLGLCLVTGNRLSGEEMLYDFRRASPIAQEAAQAFERSPGRPHVLITDALSDFQ